MYWTISNNESSASLVITNIKSCSAHNTRLLPTKTLQDFKKKLKLCVKCLRACITSEPILSQTTVAKSAAKQSRKVCAFNYGNKPAQEETRSLSMLSGELNQKCKEHKAKDRRIVNQHDLNR